VEYFYSIIKMSSFIKSFGAVLLLFTLLVSGCLFKKASSRGVMSYRSGRVFLQYGGYYYVGSLPEGWKRMDVSSKAVSFYNRSYGSSISTDAFCGRSFDDRPLDALAGELSSALSDDRETKWTEDMMMDGRGALRVFVTGTLDGVPVNMDIVVVKKDGCSFDFVAVAPPGAPEDVTRDFEGFFRGFHYE
jgi:hypothetical protein